MINISFVQMVYDNVSAISDLSFVVATTTTPVAEPMWKQY